MIDKKLSDMTLEEKTELMHMAQELGYKPQKRKMKTSKKLLYIFLTWVILIQAYVLYMIVQLQDTVSLSIVAGVAFVEAIALYVGYLRYNYGINLKSMEMNYDPNYDDNKGVY